MKGQNSFNWRLSGSSQARSVRTDAGSSERNGEGLPPLVRMSVSLRQPRKENDRELKALAAVQRHQANRAGGICLSVGAAKVGFLPEREHTEKIRHAAVKHGHGHHPLQRITLPVQRGIALKQQARRFG